MRSNIGEDGSRDTGHISSRLLQGNAHALSLFIPSSNSTDISSSQARLAHSATMQMNASGGANIGLSFGFLPYIISILIVGIVIIALAYAISSALSRFRRSENQNLVLVENDVAKEPKTSAHKCSLGASTNRVRDTSTIDLQETDEKRKHTVYRDCSEKLDLHKCKTPRFFNEAASARGQVEPLQNSIYTL